MAGAERGRRRESEAGGGRVWQEEDREEGECGRRGERGCVQEGEYGRGVWQERESVAGEGEYGREEEREEGGWKKGS